MKKATPLPVQQAHYSVVIAMGSDSDWNTMERAKEMLDQFGVATQVRILSAHRTPDAVAEFARGARAQGVQVIIAGAGGAAHLPGMIAAYTELPVIGVPVPIGAMQGEDALWSIVQMPRGVPVATVAIGNAANAGVLAAQILGVRDAQVLDRVRDFKQALRERVLELDREFQAK